MDFSEVSRLLRDLFSGNTTVDSFSIEETNKGIYEVHIVMDRVTQEVPKV